LIVSRIIEISSCNLPVIINYSVKNYSKGECELSPDVWTMEALRMMLNVIALNMKNALESGFERATVNIGGYFRAIGNYIHHRGRGRFYVLSKLCKS